MLTALIFIGCAAAGGALRFLLARILPPWFGTLTANTLACGVAGFAAHHMWWPLLVAAGTLSTWSTLAKDLGAAGRRGPILLVAHLALGYLALRIGLVV